MTGGLGGGGVRGGGFLAIVGEGEEAELFEMGDHCGVPPTRKARLAKPKQVKAKRRGRGGPLRSDEGGGPP